MSNLVRQPSTTQTTNQFETVAELFSDWIWETNEKGIYTYVSTKVKDFLGYEPDEILGKTPFDLMSEDEAIRVKGVFEHYLQSYQPFRDLENTNLHKDGHEVILLTSAFPIFDKEGRFAGYRGIDRDISPIKHLIDNLKKSQYNLLQAQKVAKIGHWELDLLGNKLIWSDEVYRIFGVEPQSFEATYEAFVGFIHPEDRQAVDEAYIQSVKNQSSYHITHKIITQQNEIKYVEERCEHLLDSQGMVIRSLGTVHDVTQRVLKNKQIYLSSKVFEHSTDAIVITDANNKIVTVNKTFTGLTGYTLDESMGKNPRFLSSGWGDGEFYQKMWHTIQNDGLWQGEIWDRKKDGTLYIAEQSIIAIKNKSGKIENYIAISHDITIAKNQQEQIKKLAFYDFLTKLPNRKFFKEKAEDYIKSSRYHQTSFALLFLDLDNFKWVNDTLGHKVGDKVLLHVAKDIQTVVKSDCVVGRLGGDEFVVLLPYNEILSVSQTAQKILDLVEIPIQIDQHIVHVGWSIGISLFPSNGDNYDDLLKNADLAMYVAKESGKNNYQYFNEEMNNNAHRRMQLQSHLKNGIKNGSFYLVYQPKIDCKSEQTVGAEALLRWNDKDLGEISPDIFIPVAEESALIVDIGYWVFEQVFIDTQKLIKQGFSDFTIAINVSVMQLEKHDVIDRVVKLLKLYGLEARYFEIEITESRLMSNIAKLDTVITKFAQHGFSIAIDDFGTGYSSLYYLSKLSFNTLKIDKAFIQNIDTKSNIITQAIMGLSKTLGFISVAEGVETQQQADILNTMGCDIIQGYHYSKPLALGEFMKYYKNCQNQ
ncbi:MAG: EAL domain-containing protein [Campylobacterales bacterium]|nr:EAL domain-containing protein [Campylobacterales bacterium]